MSVRIHIIRPEAHGPDPLHGGWIFTPATMSVTVVLGIHSQIGLTAAAAPYIPAGRHVRYIYGLNSAGQCIHMTMDFILVAIISGNSGPSMSDFQLELGPIIGAGAPVGPVGGGGEAASRGSGSCGRTGSESMGAGPCRGGYSRGPSRGGVGAGPSRGGYSPGPSSGSIVAGPGGSSSSTGPSRGGVGAGPSRGGTAASSSMCNVSGDLPAPGHGGSVIPRGSVTQRGRGRGRSGPTETVVILSGMFNLILELIRSRE